MQNNTYMTVVGIYWTYYQILFTMAYGGQRFLSNDEILKLLQSVDSDDSFDIEPDSDDEDNYQPIINEELSSSDDNSGEDIESSEQPHTNEHTVF